MSLMNSCPWTVETTVNLCYNIPTQHVGKVQSRKFEIELKKNSPNLDLTEHKLCMNNKMSLVFFFIQILNRLTFFF